MAVMLPAANCSQLTHQVDAAVRAHCNEGVLVNAPAPNVCHPLHDAIPVVLGQEDVGEALVGGSAAAGTTSRQGCHGWARQLSFSRHQNVACHWVHCHLQQHSKAGLGALPRVITC
jgi:hypothetical protein